MDFCLHMHLSSQRQLILNLMNDQMIFINVIIGSDIISTTKWLSWC